MFELTALLIGFAGSFHCVTMCGPIVLALAGGKESNARYFAGRTIYNMGRICTYIILGVLAGAAGHTLMMAGLQKSISISIGVIMILSVIIIYYLPGTGKTGRPFIQINKFIRGIFSAILKKRNRLALFLSGLANGILPCGFVYLAMAGAAATQSITGGMLYMALFGLGTFPAMMAVSVFGKLAGLKTRSILTKAAPVMMILLGMFFIYRGIQMQTQSCCHHSNRVTTSVMK
jgi:sulfite exporter TauE/SafE